MSVRLFVETVSERRHQTNITTIQHAAAIECIMKFIGLTLSFLYAAAYGCCERNVFMLKRLHSSHVRNSVRIFQWANYCNFFRLFMRTLELQKIAIAS